MRTLWSPARPDTPAVVVLAALSLAWPMPALFCPALVPTLTLTALAS
ncbi:hypothetical protein GTZ97_06470 [Aquabacterium fontiphilum]|nr:hypothetical protein [Aquabacterium fontiphilum]NBD20314.1 hypothetical protein [Aquabacterium fontiphilum]